MLSRKVIAIKVNNLTDARYFAAWGVDYLVYDLDVPYDEEQVVSQLKELKEWVEGPCFLINTPLNINKVQLQDLIVKAELDGVISSDENLITALEAEHIFRITTLNQYKALKHTQSEEYFLYNVSLSELDELPTHIGLVLEGGDEEKTGLKIYDNLDPFFEALSD